MTGHSRLKSNADKRIGDLEFMVGDWVLFKVSTIKDVVRFRKKDNIRLSLIGPFRFLDALGRWP